ncbi:heme oxygenase-like protein [Lophiostoma macrostomum CBS 122681]|uniref:Heme oxygenase-like protein n=1 Tax=Lophiostoma macrostomum CBS 122681 TaxID=1314788 RepID=A0A6A6SM64_9PLEO|nr:heme oxygenase-like protein [Lophiostoma macrostomum CBS 122681]
MSTSPTPPKLSTEINTATRALHTTLNRLITSRLPLALPPHAPDPTLYTTGLLHFSHIFLTFESIWTDLLSTSSSTSGPTSPPTSPLLSFLLVNPYDSPDLFTSTRPPPAATLHFLSTLRPRGLARSGRVKADLETLTGLHKTDLDVLLATYPGECVAQFCAHIRRAVRVRPHVLVAYAWCYYMAVFSGGRWIRAQLVGAGEAFWRKGAGIDSTSHADGEKGQGKAEAEDSARVGLADQGLSLWHFDGAHDGEDIKAEFKARLAAAEDLFTDDERVDIIEEAKHIFKFSAGLVEELDEKLGTDMERLVQAERAERASARAKTVVEQTGGVKGLPPKVAKSPVLWLKRPEVTGAVVALGCLACVALLTMDARIFL